MPSNRVVLLAIDSELCRIAARRLAASFPGLTVIVEQRVPRRRLLARRVARLGALRVAGQLAFMGYARLLGWVSRRRIEAIMHEFRLEPRWPDKGCLIHVPSVNATECIARLRQIDPGVVLVVGTRIISGAVLSSVAAPFINYHDGITPKYRGINGGYWAKAHGDIANFGVTVHLVDTGIDTGAVLYQARLKPGSNDNYATMPYLQLATALPLMEQATRDAMAGSLIPQKVDLPSRMRTHPTLWGYIAAGLSQGAW